MQLREAVKRKHADLADHFAIPQSNQVGDQIDWYAPFEGDVIPWTAATEEERAPARAKLEEVRATLKLMSANLLDGANGEPQGDRAVLAKLLTRVMNFPDESFVYLVAGKPVLTFWGFDHTRTPHDRNPLQCLYPGVTPVAPPIPVAPPVVAPVAAAAAPVIAAAGRPWWHWLLLALALALLLALLLFGLRACGPRVGINIPGFTLPAVSVPAPDISLRQPAGTVPTGTLTTGTGLVPAAGGAVPPAGGTVPPAGGLATPPSGGAPDPSGINPLTPPGADAKAAPSAPLTPPGGPATPPAGPDAAPNPAPAPIPPQLPPAQGQATPPAGAPLAMPPNLPDGNASFLNGNWRAGAGIQDARTGQPLRLEYQFNDGKGNVTVRRGDGVACSAPVAATMKNGSLAMSSAEQANCGDGGKYDMPQVSCKPGAQTIADCTGTYGKDQFPLSMRQASQ
ncbi:hypothetical protein D3C86_566940 [compost metagenome]